ncbi:MAG: TlpA disulfide reductase family protein [Bryobacteraceae bacterium]
MRRRLFLSLLLALAPAIAAQGLSGLWDATVTVNGLTIPFRMEFSGSGADIRGAFFNGDEKVPSTGGRFDNGSLVLNFDHYATRLEASLKDGALIGTYGREGRAYPFSARPAAASPAVASLAEAGNAPNIAGDWELAVKSPKGELAWHFIVRQSGAQVSAAILRVDGDTGTLTGSFRGGKFVLSHFSGARPALLEVTPQPDGTLEVVQNGRNKLTATRPAEARAKGLPGPTDPFQHTSVKDPAEPLHFQGVDLNGRAVSDADPRFHGKVVIVAISGSWCPNCHDEAPFLEELYRTYRAQGLEIVALSFEEAEQFRDPTRLRAFVKQYGLEYTVLLAGETSELHAKLPQAVNLDAWPTTFFLGRDGRVRSIHAGFAAPASGEFHKVLRAEVTSLVEKLLAERPTTEPPVAAARREGR